MSQWNISYPKDMLKEAVSRGKELVSYGTRQAAGGGRYEATTYMDEENATLMWLMLQHFSTQDGKATFEDSLAYARDRVEKAKESRAKRLAAKADGPAGGGA